MLYTLSLVEPSVKRKTRSKRGTLKGRGESVHPVLRGFQMQSEDGEVSAEDQQESAEAEEVAEEISDAARLLAEERAGKEQLMNRLKYAQADFENYRKRVEREAKASADAALADLVSKLLPVVDELDLAVAGREADGESGTLVEGIEMVRKNLKATLEKEGLRRIEASGKPFDPVYHEAVESVEADASKQGMVVDELRAGYVFRDQVLRPSMVRVGVAPKQSEVPAN